MLVLSQADVRRLLDLDQLLDALERVFVEFSAGRALLTRKMVPSLAAGLVALVIVTLIRR